MKIRSYAKINWALKVLGKTKNNYHLLDMLMQNISIYDDIIIKPSISNDSIVKSSIYIGESQSNICYKAIKLYNSLIDQNDHYEVYIDKNIAMGAGMGGGSSNAAAVLIALNILNHNALNTSQLMNLGLKLGADVPFFINSNTARVRGIGEIIENINDNIDYDLIVVYNGINLKTASVFSNYNIKSDYDFSIDYVLDNLVKNNLNDLDNLFCYNSLLKPALSINPNINNVLLDLKNAGAEFINMTGSGSACFGIFNDKNILNKAFLYLSSKYPYVKICKSINKSYELID